MHDPKEQPNHPATDESVVITPAPQMLGLDPNVLKILNQWGIEVARDTLETHSQSPSTIITEPQKTQTLVESPPLKRQDVTL